MDEKKQEVWRLVDGWAIRCTDCQFNKEQALTPEEASSSVANGVPIGVEYRCTAKDEICDFMKKPIDSQKWYGSAKEAYADTEDDTE